MKLLRFACFVTLAMLLAAARPVMAQLINIDDRSANSNATVVNGINNNGIAVGYYFDATTGAQHLFTFNVNTRVYTNIADAPGRGSGRQSGQRANAEARHSASLWPGPGGLCFKACVLLRWIMAMAAPQERRNPVRWFLVPCDLPLLLRRAGFLAKLANPLKVVSEPRGRRTHILRAFTCPCAICPFA